MNRKTALIIILLIATSLPVAWASEAYVSIQESEDDVWMTEAGNVFGYEASVQMLHEDIGIRSFLRFADVPLLKSSKINLAQLRVYAGFDQGESPSSGAKVTIYGIAEADCAPFSYSGQVWSLERPTTQASVNWDLETWSYGWHSVNVTDIVKEIINQYPWEQNNSLGFQILGASDTDYAVRTFEDIDHQFHGAYALLYIQYDVPPGTPPSGIPGTAILVETYGDYDIWTSLEYENFYEDYTETDPQGLLSTSEDTPYRITFNNFGGETYNGQNHYFQRNVDINSTADTIDSRFSCTITDDDVAYTSQDFYWIYQDWGTEWIATGHIGTIPNHDFEWVTNWGSYGGQATHITGPIPPPDTVWVRMLWNYTDDSMNISCFESEPASDWEWENAPDSSEYHDGVAISQERYDDYFAMRARPASINGWSDGYLENLVIIVDDVPVSNDTVYYVVDENGTIVWTDIAPDVGWVEDYIDDYVDPQGGDPLDPAPGSGWEESGPFTRFRMRLYFMVLGLSCIFGPLWAISYKRPGPQGVAWCAILMLIGLGLLISIPNI